MGAILSSSSPLDNSLKKVRLSDTDYFNTIHSSVIDGNNIDPHYSNYQQNSVYSIQENGFISNSFHETGRKGSVAESSSHYRTTGQRRNLLTNISRKNKSGSLYEQKYQDEAPCDQRNKQSFRKIQDNDKGYSMNKSTHKLDVAHCTSKELRDNGWSDAESKNPHHPISFRNGTPYCRNLSASLYEPSPMKQEIDLSTKSHTKNKLTIPEKHVHFCQRRQLSIPPSGLPKRNSYCIGENQQPMNIPLSQSPYSSSRNRRSVDHFDSSPLPMSMNEYVCAYQWNSDIFNPLTANSSSHCITPNITAYQCCPSHLECDRYSMPKSTVPSSQRQSSPHPLIQTRVSSQTPNPCQNSESHHILTHVKNGSKISEDLNSSRRSQGIYNRCSSRKDSHNRASHESAHEELGPRCRRLTKSVSCYALKFFTHYQNQHQSRHSQEPPSRLQRVQTLDSDKSKSSVYNTGLSDKQRLNYLKRSQSHKGTVDGCDQRSIHQMEMDKSYSDKNLNVVWKEKRGNRRKLIMVPVSTGDNVNCFNNERSQLHRTTSNDKQYNHSYRNLDITSELINLRINMHGASPAPYDTKHTLCKATTSELLRCISFFVVAKIHVNHLGSTNQNKMNRLRTLQPAVIIGWIKSIDRALLVQGWSDLAFINPAHLVFLFMMLKDCLDGDISSERELHTIVMACLYLSYSYMGNEISYPLKPFLVAETNQLLIQNKHTNRAIFEGENALLNGHGNAIRSKVIDQVRNRFWQYCLRIINVKSAGMLQINAQSAIFTELFSELKSYESVVLPLNCAVRLASTPN